MQITKISLSEQARNALLELIVSGKLAAGTRLTEESLCHDFNISRTPVRDALSRLEADGMIERLPSRGYQVKTLDSGAVNELLDCRATVELEIFSGDYDNICMEDLQKLRDELAALDPAAPDALSDARRIDDALHNAVNQACRNRYWKEIHARLLKQRLPYRDLRNTGTESLAIRLKNERLSLLDEILSGDMERGAKALFEHLQSGKLEILKVMNNN